MIFLRHLKHLKYLIFFSTLLLAMQSADLSAQCKQDVIVVLYQGDNNLKPISNVEVRVCNAGTVVTDKDGRCTLDFRKLKPGDKVEVRSIERPGYEVLNQAVLDNWYISNSNELFKIVMCEKEFLDKLRNSFRKELGKLSKEYGIRLEDVEGCMDSLANIDLSTIGK